MENATTLFDRPEFVDFKDKYRSAKAILELDKNKWYLDLLTNTYDNEEEVNFIKRVNDLLEISVVYTWLKIHKDEIEDYQEKLRDEDKLGGDNQRQLRISIGAFWGWIMQYDPKYNFNMHKYTKQRIKGNLFNFHTAMRYKK